MKKKNILKIAMTLFMSLWINNSYSQTNLYYQGFETDLSGYSQTPNQTPSTDPGDQYFSRAEPSNGDIYETGSNGPYTNITGSWLFVGSNPNTINSGNPGILSTGLIDVAGYENFELSIDFGAVPSDWDTADDLIVEYSWNNTDWSTLYNFVSSGTNQPLDLASNSIGGSNTANGATLTYALQTIVSTNFTGSGNSLYIRVVCDSAANYEAFGLDNIILTGTAASANPTVSFNAATSSETETDVTFATSGIPITLTNYDADVTITATVNGTSTAESGDYSISTFVLVFDANDTLTIPLSINDDTDFDDETIVVDFTVTSGTADLGTSTHTVTITDDENPPSIGFDAITSSETETDATFTSANIPITVSDYSGEQIDINVAITGGTAEVDDYIYTTQSLSFTTNETQNITIDIKDDADTDDETIILTISETSSVTGLTISEATHTITITDNETPTAPTLVITEIADTGDNDTARFVEIYNNGLTDIDFSVTPIYISRFTNGNPTATSSNVEELSTGTLSAGHYLVIASSGTNFTSVYGFSADEINGGFGVNGDDPFGMYSGTHPNGTLFDVYGEIGVDGTGQSWEYENSRAVRNNKMELPSTTWQASSWTISSANVADATPGASENEFRYDGAWKPRDVYANATTTDDIYISSDVNLTANLSVNNFEVTTGQIATINSGNSLIVTGTSSGNVTYNTTLGSENWYLVSSPVVGETYDNDYVNTNSLAINGTNNAIATYTTSSDEWSYMQTDGGLTFSTGTGYSVRRETGAGSGTISFTGTINTSDTPVGVVIGGNGGFNLIGNPYTSYLNSASFLTDNSGSLVSETIWVWNQASGVYETKVTGTGFVLAPTQGFFVSANTATDLNIVKSYQTNTGDTFQKTVKTEVTLNMTDGTNNRFAKMYYLNNVTKGFDNGFDGETFGGIANTLDIFTHLITDNQGKNYQIQSLPNSDYETMVIPVGLYAEADKEITFTAAAINLPFGIKVYLEDRLTNTFTRLDEANSNYKVTLTESLNGIGRFYLHTKSNSVLSANEFNVDNISIYTTNSNTLRIAGLSQEKTNVKLFTMLGKQVLNTSFSSNGIKDVYLPNLATGIYVVQLETSTKQLNKKITLE